MPELKEAARRALASLDLTNLNDDCDAAAIESLCKRAQAPRGPVAAVCIWPRFVAQAKNLLSGTGIRIATVVNFPGGNDPADEVLSLTKTALADGADEIDLVVPYTDLMEGKGEAVRLLVHRVKEVSGDATLKTILETGVLSDDDLIRQAARLALEGGADFLKTSTGKVPVNATPDAARLVLEEIKASGKSVGFKPAGGVKTTEDAAVYLGLCDEIMGEGWATPATFRIGASGVLAALLATLDDQDAPTTSSGY